MLPPTDGSIMYLKLARGNVRRSLRDYSVYFATLALAACLLYSFIASGDYLTALDLTPEQRGVYGSMGGVLEGFSVFVVVVFIFLVAYANRFIVRRRKREFGMYALLGMERHGVACVLAFEGGIVGAAALVAGILAGVVLSPVFGLIAAFVFDAPWRLLPVFSAGAATWTACSFAAITALGSAACVRDVVRRPLIELMSAERAPERMRFASARGARVQLALAVPLLAVVWGSCIFQPMYFVVFIIPMGFAAFGATMLVMRAGAWRLGERARRKPERYWDGLRPFTVRQTEARISSTSAALACVCVLIAPAVCMICAGFAFSVGMRAPGAVVENASSLAPIGYIGIFYGAAFLVTAAAILALQQLSGAADARRAYETLRELGCDRELARDSLRQQVRLSFAAPLGCALVHDVFGLILVAFLALVLGSGSFALVVAGTLAFTLALMGAYYRITCRACERLLL